MSPLISILESINTLSANPAKWSNTHKQFVGNTIFPRKRSKTWFSDPRPVWHKKKINCSDPRPDCNIRSFFLPNCQLFYFVYCLFSIRDVLLLVDLCCVSCILNLSEQRRKKAWMSRLEEILEIEKSIFKGTLNYRLSLNVMLVQENKKKDK